MGRPLRDVAVGVTVHVFNRTAHLEPVFTTTARKKIVIDVYKKAQEKFEFELHSFVIMDNHVHAVITITNEEHSISKIMHWTNMMIAKRMNKEIERVGPFWNERFSSVEVYSFPKLNLYIGYNPVRKKFCDYPGNYEYSSYLKYFNPDFDYPLKITYHPQFLQLGKTFEEAVEEYKKIEFWFLEENPELKAVQK